MKKLVDTNIFLEILLDQPARPKCEAFLDNNEDAAGISDFSLHSLGVLLFRKNRAELFRRFVSDILPELSVLTLSNPGKKKADLELTSYQGALKGSGSGLVLLSGNLDGSKLWKALTHSEEPFMPPNRPKLDDKDLEKFKKWILGGLLETASGKAVPA